MRPHSPVDDSEMIPDVRSANQTAFYFDWMAVTEFFHESKCLMYYRIQPRTAAMQAYLDDTCHCKQKAKAEVKDVNVVHYDGRRRHTMLDLDEKLLRKIAAATTTDAVVFPSVLTQFMQEIAWLETSLGRRVLCDAPLAKWEPEFAYLNVSVTELYHLPREMLLQQQEESHSAGG